MLIGFSVPDRIGGNGARAYQCSACGGLITYSDRLIPIEGTNRHFFVNPAGAELNFHTFQSCPGAISIGEPTEEQTWFSGYYWRMAFCSHCGQHLGWYYEAISRYDRPSEFWGIIVNNLTSE
ncbi:MAG: cereblon family protein [Pseudomonadota bacterium]